MFTKGLRTDTELHIPLYLHIGIKVTISPYRICAVKYMDPFQKVGGKIIGEDDLIGGVRIGRGLWLTPRKSGVNIE